MSAVRLALAALVLAMGANGCGGGGRTPLATPPLAPLADTTPTTTAADPVAARSRFDRVVVQLERATALRERPGGRVLTRLRPTTEFGSLMVLAVVRDRGEWLGVLSPQLANGQVGWISAHAALRRFVTDFRIDASLRRREVVVRNGARVIARFPVAIGAPATPTPLGRFAVTDKLLTRDPGSPYGCCIIALSGRQPHTPQGWGGGDRIAIHATDKPSTIGLAASFGCLRAPEDAMRRIIRSLPLGTLVTIRA